jgi:hypothetical protein
MILLTLPSIRINYIRKINPSYHSLHMSHQKTINIDVSEERKASIFRVNQISNKPESTLLAPDFWFVVCLAYSSILKME